MILSVTLSSIYYIKYCLYFQGKNKSHSGKCDLPRCEDAVTAVSILKMIGLSQYESIFKSHGIITRQHFLDLKEKDLRNMGIKNVDHLHRLLSWQHRVEMGEARARDFELGSKGQRLSDLRDKV